MSESLPSSPLPSRQARRERPSTRAAVLEAAGRVFAERGYAEATSKEICQLAGANAAAVNYYFGGKEGLYQEVLTAAHRQFDELEDLDWIVSAPLPAEERLRNFLAGMLRTASASSELWGGKIFLRELASPSAMALRNIPAVVMPKRLKIASLVRELTGLPEGSERLAWTTSFVIMPLIGTILFPRALRALFLPKGEEDFDALLDALQSYVLKGLEGARAEGASREGRDPAPPRPPREKAPPKRAAPRRRGPPWEKARSARGASLRAGPRG